MEHFATPASSLAQRVLVTGASGFIGRGLVQRLHGSGYPVRAAFRGAPAQVAPGIEAAVVGDIDPKTDWKDALDGVRTVIHLAARVHIGNEPPQALPLYRAVNAAGSETLARAARQAGVRRFVLVSTTTVYGNASRGTPYDESSPLAPCTPYAQSKAEGEQLVREALRQSSTELVVLRPPLVYGAGAKGNFQRLVRLVSSGLPLPFASVNNRRSLVFVDNFVDALLHVVENPAARGTYVVCDGPALSTAEIVRLIARSLGRRSRLVPFPPSALRMTAAIMGRGAEATRLLDDMEVDDSRIRSELGWKPPYSVEEAVRMSIAAAG